MPINITHLCIHTITVQENNPVHDGAGGHPDNWEDVHIDIRARVRPVSAAERSQWGGLPAILSHIVYVADASLSIRENNRILFGSRAFDVLGVRNVDEWDKYLIVNVREIR